MSNRYSSGRVEGGGTKSVTILNSFDCQDSYLVVVNCRDRNPVRPLGI